jgi:hypothetical protein
MTKIVGSESGSGSIIQRHGPADLDPHQNVVDPEHCFQLRDLRSLTVWRALNHLLLIHAFQFKISF